MYRGNTMWIFSKVEQILNWGFLDLDVFIIALLIAFPH